jgi:hypothetical protein
MSDVFTDLEAWFKDRPKWLQEATKLLIENESLTEEITKSLFQLCGKESKGDAITFRTVLRDELCFGETKEEIKLKKICEIAGVNDLSPRNPLIFGDSNLSIVFGGNGSGKSGYTRTLKHICGAKHLGKLLGNVFKSEDENISCKLTITRDGKESEIPWEQSNGIVKSLSSIEIFDSGCADVYATKENEVAYEPFILRLFTRIIGVCTNLAELYDKDALARPSKKPKMPPELATTSAGIWYGKFNSKTSSGEVTENCTWADSHEEELKFVSERLAIANPLEQAKLVRRTKANLVDLKTKLDSASGALSDSSCEMILVLKSSAMKKRRIVEAEAKKVFENSPLEGVGAETWKVMWDAAREYSTLYAYKEIGFPNTGEKSLCVLCQQQLGDLAKNSFKNFESFVNGVLEKQALEAETFYNNAINELPIISSVTETRSSLDAAGITDELFRGQIIEYLTSINSRKGWLLKTVSKDGMVEIVPLNYAIQLDALSTALEDRAQKFESDAKGQNRAALESKRTELQAKKWTSQQHLAVSEEISRLKILDMLKRAKSLTTTQQLSTKKSALAEDLLSAEYLKRFKTELSNLGGNRIKAEIVKTRADKGKVYHQLVLSNKVKSGSIEDILSHGEYRIVSLAAFLADGMGRGSNSPFIFDDPISSLDQEYEDKLVKRLVELSKVRQVIVFTHRLSLLSSLIDVGTKENVEPTEICIRAEAWGKGEPSETSFFAKKPDKAINNLKNDRLAKAKKILLEKGRVEYDYLAKGICSDFRILLERIIESELLSDVVVRFRRSVITKDKIEKLSRIKHEDCKMLDELMTKYSYFEHSQPSETPVELPTPDELEVDFLLVGNWIAAFRARA